MTILFIKIFLFQKKPYNEENLNESLKAIQLLEQLRLSSIRGNLEGVKNAIEQGKEIQFIY